MATDNKFTQDFRAARRASVPIVAVETADPANCMRQIRLAAKETPLISWDKAEGFQPKNEGGKKVLEACLGCLLDDEGNPTNAWKIKAPETALIASAKFPGKSNDGKVGGTIVFFLNGHLFLDPMIYNSAPDVMQALWNLRDLYKQDMRTLVIPCPGIKLPEELKQDVLILDDPLPTPADLEVIVKSLHVAAKLDLAPSMLTKGVEACRGLSAFSAEQQVAMSLTKDGLNLDRLWDRKRKTIEQTPGLRIWRGTETYADVEGVENMKEYLSMIMESNDPPTVAVFWDEMEKAFAGSTGGDLSGTSEELHGMILSWMADEEVLALRMMGHAGCSKSYIVKATAGQFKRPLLLMNISELKSQFVGQSAQRTRGALKMISAIGKPLVLGTCNNEDALSPELKDRFNLGTFFFDLPSEQERLACWNLYMEKFHVKSELPSDERGWTPRNIRDCVALAARLKCDLEKASRYIVPVIRSNPQGIESLRRKASGRYLSSSKPGVYVYTPPPSPAAAYQKDDSIRVVNVDQKIGEA